jgi:hypothetical protein
MKKYLFIISFICTTILGNAQIEFSGYIKDKDDSTPIIGANVYIPELNRGVATDGNGFF